MRCRLLIGMAGALLLAGCGGGDEFELIDVSGTVDFKGAPIADGAIKFVAQGQATDGSGPAIPARAVQIVNGEFDATGRGGIAPGDYKIEFEAYEPNPAASMDAAQEEGPLPEGMIVKRQVLPEALNTKSSATLTIESGSDPIVKTYKLEENEIKDAEE